MHQQSQDNTDATRDLARFWTDNPRFSGLPAGHWMSIVVQTAEQHGLTLEDTVEAMALTGIALHDAFLDCWTWKYRYQLLRPVTFVHRYIDPAWTTWVNTPQFPEYTSGHSVASRAASTVLTDLLGELPFEDTDALAHGRRRGADPPLRDASPTPPTRPRSRGCTAGSTTRWPSRTARRRATRSAPSSSPGCTPAARLTGTPRAALPRTAVTQEKPCAAAARALAVLGLGLPLVVGGAGAASAAVTPLPPGLPPDVSSSRTSYQTANVSWTEVDATADDPVPGNWHLGNLFVQRSGYGLDVFGSIDDFECEPGETPGGGGHGIAPGEPSPEGVVRQPGHPLPERLSPTLGLTVDIPGGTVRLRGTLVASAGGHDGPGRRARPSRRRPHLEEGRQLLPVPALRGRGRTTPRKFSSSTRGLGWQASMIRHARPDELHRRRRRRVLRQLRAVHRAHARSLEGPRRGLTRGS